MYIEVEEGLALNNKYKVLDGSTTMKGNNIFNPKLQLIHTTKSSLYISNIIY